MSTLRTHRRSFLKSAAAATAAAPFLLPSHLWAAETKANDKLGLGFIGNGTQGRGLLGGFLGKNEIRAVAVCDVDPTRRESARKIINDHYSKQTGDAYTACDAYKDFRQLLGRKDIDAVVIATPDHWHAAIAIAACEAGKDIYCEKPLTQSILEARTLVAAVRRTNRVFQTGSMQRSSREFRIACELVRNGRIGKIKNVEVGVGGPAVPCDLPPEPVEPGLDWTMWLGPSPQRAYNSVLSPRGVHKHFPDWRKYREYGGGGVTDWGAHHFDIAQWGLGMDESGPLEIIPATQPNAQHGVRLKYAGDIEVLHKENNGVWFYGTEGTLYVNRGKFELSTGGKQIASSTKDLDTVSRDLLSDAKVKLYNSTDHKADWLGAIKSRQMPICDVEVGARSVTVCHLVNLAYYHGQRMKWDPATNEFTGGTGRKEWLDIAQRAPWKVT